LSEDASKGPGPFDVRTITQLARLMSRHDLSEIDLRHGDWTIRLCRDVSGDGTLVRVPSTSVAQPNSTPPTSPPPEPPQRQLIEIKSPTVGTFYAQEKPGAPRYVQVGSRVSPDTVVCLIEAMKLFNEVTADCTGVITEVLAKDTQPVEFAQVLFRVDPTG
jgi:acetyl-CoA carboxylase biotin carboxyl carrier protein